MNKVFSLEKFVIEDTDFHHSHLLVKRVCGYQVMAATYRCDGVALNYDVHLYDKMQSKIEYMIELSKSLPSIYT